MEKITTNL